MGKMKLELDTLAVVSYSTTPELRGNPAAVAETRTWTCTQTTACSNCTLMEQV